MNYRNENYLDMEHARSGKKHYVVSHVSKFNMSSVKGVSKHIQRDMKTSTNEDIDPSKMHLNYELSNFDKEKSTYSSVIKDRLKVGYTSNKTIRKDAVLMVGIVISSDSEFFKKLSLDEQKTYFKTAYDYLCDQFNKDNVIAATVHLDEKTPHMHFSFVPLTRDGRLSAKEIINKDALFALQENLPKSLRHKGFDINRGLPRAQTKSKHVDPKTWKKRQANNELERAKQLSSARTRRDEQAKQLLNCGAGESKATTRTTGKGSPHLQNTTDTVKHSNNIIDSHSPNFVSTNRYINKHTKDTKIDKQFKVVVEQAKEKIKNKGNLTSGKISKNI